MRLSRVPLACCWCRNSVFLPCMQGGNNWSDVVALGEGRLYAELIPQVQPIYCWGQESQDERPARSTGICRDGLLLLRSKKVYLMLPLKSEALSHSLTQQWPLWKSASRRWGGMRKDPSPGHVIPPIRPALSPLCSMHKILKNKMEILLPKNFSVRGSFGAFKNVFKALLSCAFTWIYRHLYYAAHVWGSEVSSVELLLSSNLHVGSGIELWSSSLHSNGVTCWAVWLTCTYR